MTSVHSAIHTIHDTISIFGFLMMMSVYSTGWLMNMEQLVECEFAEETEVRWENPPQCHSINHQSHMKHFWTTNEPPKWAAGN
jgi:hypothetical protein